MRYLKTITHYAILLSGLLLVTILAAELALRLSGQGYFDGLYAYAAARD